MRRRDLAVLLLGLGSPLRSAFMPATAFAQDNKARFRLAVLAGSPSTIPQFVALFDELGKSGLIEGQKLVIDRRGFERPDLQYAEVAGELVAERPDMIFCAGYAAIHAAQRATTTIPLVAIDDDMIANQFVRSLAHPGGNITGVSIFASELDGKRLEILIELVPTAHRIALLADPNATPPPKLESLRNAAQARGVELSFHHARKPEEIAPAMAGAKAAGAEALNVLATPLFAANRKLIIDGAALAGLPAIFQWPEMADQGGLAAYGPRSTLLYRQMARQMVKIFKGTKPADIPVEQPATFELVINLKTAQALGLAVPPSILARADEVIE